MQRYQLIILYQYINNYNYIIIIKLNDTLHLVLNSLLLSVMSFILPPFLVDVLQITTTT